MPLCPRCGAAHQREDEVCAECGKRLRTVARVDADQATLSFPTCVAGPTGCLGPAVEGPDGRLRCTAHRLDDRRPEPRSSEPVCVDGPDGCRGPAALRPDGRLVCEHHRDIGRQPWWRRLFSRRRDGG